MIPANWNSRVFSRVLNSLFNPFFEHLKSLLKRKNLGKWRLTDKKPNKCTTHLHLGEKWGEILRFAFQDGDDSSSFLPIRNFARALESENRSQPGFPFSSLVFASPEIEQGTRKFNFNSPKKENKVEEKSKLAFWVLYWKRKLTKILTLV